MNCNLCQSSESSEYILKKGFLFKPSAKISICDSCMELFLKSHKIFLQDMSKRMGCDSNYDHDKEFYYSHKGNKNRFFFKDHYEMGKEFEFFNGRGGFKEYKNKNRYGRGGFSRSLLFKKSTKELSSWIKELINDFGNEDVISYVKKRFKKDRAEFDAYLKREKKKEQKQLEKKKKQKTKIVSFLKKEKTKLPASDIDFQLRIGDVDLVKALCEEMYRDKKIGRTGNYRYFV
jgi:hypothetical protein